MVFSRALYFMSVFNLAAGFTSLIEIPPTASKYEDDEKPSKVTFKPLSDNDIANYCQTNEPIGKAGGYAIQGKGALLIEKLEGSYSGVMGLPLDETHQLLIELLN